MNTDDIVKVENMKSEINRLEEEIKKYYINEVNYPIIITKKDTLKLKLLEEFKLFYSEKGFSISEQITKYNRKKITAVLNNYNIEFSEDEEYYFQLNVPNRKDQYCTNYTIFIEESKKDTHYLKGHIYKKDTNSIDVLEKLFIDIQEDIENLKKYGEGVNDIEFVYKFYEKCGIDGDFRSYTELIEQVHDR